MKIFHYEKVQETLFRFLNFLPGQKAHLVLSGIRVKFVTQSSGYYRSIYGSLIDNFLKELKYFRRQLWRAGGTQAKISAKYGPNRLCCFNSYLKKGWSFNFPICKKWTLNRSWVTLDKWHWKFIPFAQLTLPMKCALFHFQLSSCTEAVYIFSSSEYIQLVCPSLI